MQRGTHIGCARQIEREAGADFHRQHIEQPALLRLLHAVAVESGLNIGIGGACAVFVQTLFHRGQHLLGVVEIAAPHAGNVLTGVFQHRIGIGFVHKQRLLGRLLRAFVAPGQLIVVVGGNQIIFIKHSGLSNILAAASLRYFQTACLILRNMLDRMRTITACGCARLRSPMRFQAYALYPKIDNLYIKYPKI